VGKFQINCTTVSGTNGVLCLVTQRPYTVHKSSLFEVSTLLKLRGFSKRAIANLALKGQYLEKFRVKNTVNFAKGLDYKIVNIEEILCTILILKSNRILSLQHRKA
jgi:hypothetical protein